MKDLRIERHCQCLNEFDIVQYLDGIRYRTLKSMITGRYAASMYLEGYEAGVLGL